MCLYKKHIFPKLAKEDIIVEKYLELEKTDDNRVYLITPVQRFKLTSSLIKSRNYWFLGIFKSIIKGEGVHSYKEGYNTFYSAYCKAIIPKGSWYYEGKHWEYASSSLIITTLSPHIINFINDCKNDKEVKLYIPKELLESKDIKIKD